MNSHSAPTTYTRTGGFASAPVSGDARDALIVEHLPKVRYIADRIAAKLPPSVERDDLYGAGVIGLIDAVERYDAARGVAFTTFAEMRVRGAILDNLRSTDWASRTMRRRGREIQNAYFELEQQHGRSVTEEEVAAHLDIPLAEFRENLQDMRALQITNLDDRDEATGHAIADLIADKAGSPLDKISEEEYKRHLAAAVGKLPTRERHVIALYYLEEMTMKEIGETLGVTESRVSQMRSQAILRLRAALKRLI